MRIMRSNQIRSDQFLAIISSRDVRRHPTTSVNEAARVDDDTLVETADDFTWGTIVDTWMSCSWMAKLAEETMLEAGFVALLAAKKRA